jgi:glycosyltransferase involved in cell wall biosynthesis
MIKLSVVIISLNEERNIGRCLKSVQYMADEIIVVDSKSTDNTQSLCEAAGAIFSVHPFVGHIEQKNYALTLAKYPYILSLDADEALSDELKYSILDIKRNWKFDGYSMNRLTNYCGSWIKHSGWYPNRKIRLFHREKGQWGGINPHDKFLMEPNTTILHLKGDLLHYSYYSIEEHRDRTIQYAEISAKALFDSGKNVSIIYPLLSAITKFLREYILYQGFIDGYNGLIISKMSAIGTYIKYKKLYKLNRDSIDKKEKD